MSLKFTSIPTKTLSESITASATSFKLSDIKGWDGSDLTSADFGTEGYGVFRNAAGTLIEFFKFDPTTIADSSITISLRGLKIDAADLTTEVSANKLSWTKGDTFVDLGTDSPQVLQYLKEYIDAASIQGAVDASDSAKGVTKLSKAPAVSTNPIAVGDNDDRISGGGNFGTPSITNKFLTEDWAASTSAFEAVTFDASGTWTKDDGLQKVFVRVWGGGGSGGKYSTQEAGGGGGGGYAEGWFLASELGATETVTVGAGGAAVSADQTAGNVGGTTTFGSLLSAYGGGGGGQGATGAGGGGGGSMFAAGATASGATAGAGGAGGAGQLFAGDGGNGSGSGTGESSYFGGAGGGGTDGTTADDGGDSFWGGAGGGSAETPNTGAGGTSTHGGDGGAGAASGNATAGTQPGGGGGGVYGSGSSGAGGDGRVVVYEFYT